jgi:hypothetical protein
VRQFESGSYWLPLSWFHSEEFPMTNLNNAIAAYRMHIRCKAERNHYEAESYYQIARYSAALHAEETDTTRYAVMMDVIDHHITNPIYS